MTNQKTPVQGGATEEQIEAAARAMWDHPDAGDEYTWAEMVTGDPSRAELWREDARRVVEAALSASASADPADEHHDAEERDEWCREESCQYRHWRSGGMPTHRRGTGCPAESEDHAATVTGETRLTHPEAWAPYTFACSRSRGCEMHDE